MRLTGSICVAAALLLALQGCCCPDPCATRASRCGPTGSPDAESVAEAKPLPPGPYASKGEKSAWEYLLKKYDTDEDGAISKEEHGRGEAAFRNLDKDRDGTITEKDFPRGTRMDQMVTRMTLARYFQVDGKGTDLHRKEVEASFKRHDADRDGALSRKEVDPVLESEEGVPDDAPPKMVGGMDPFACMLRTVDGDGSGTLSLEELGTFFDRFHRGDGVWRIPRRMGPRRETGVAPGKPAPDFTLRPPEGGAPVTLSDFQGKMPVALIFGSYT